MADARVTCPHCQGRMAEGYCPDSTYGGYREPTWVAGAPEKSIWRGLKLRGKLVLPIRTFRCERCGFLASYAN